MDLIGLNFQLSDEIAPGIPAGLRDAEHNGQEAEDRSSPGAVGHQWESTDGLRIFAMHIRFAARHVRVGVAAIQPALRTASSAGALRLYRSESLQARSDRLRSALRQWNDSHTLPPANDLGISAIPLVPASTR